jgi:hypothetical protein
LVESALPFFNGLSAAGKAKSVTVTTDYGSGSAETVDFKIEMNGAVQDGKLREAISVSGLKIPAVAVPQWAAKLVPEDFSFDFAFSGFDADAPMKLIVDNLDLTQDPPLKLDVQERLLGLVLPQGTMKLAINPGLIRSPTYALTYEGALDVRVAGKPSGKAKLKMQGFQKTIETLQKAAQSDPSVNQVIGPLLAVQGFAKSDGADLVWNVEVTEQGGILVNGIDVSKMAAP